MANGFCEAKNAILLEIADPVIAQDQHLFKTPAKMCQNSFRMRIRIGKELGNEDLLNMARLRQKLPNRLLSYLELGCGILQHLCEFLDALDAVVVFS